MKIGLIEWIIAVDEFGTYQFQLSPPLEHFGEVFFVVVFAVKNLSWE
jgi:hypothetical protein